MYLKRLLAVVIMVLATHSLEADLLEAYFDVNAGYRRDDISAHICSRDEEKSLISEEYLKAEDLKLYQVGVKTQAVFFDWFLRGEAYWGSTDNGIYREVSKIADYKKWESKTDLHKGRTKDYTLGAGYFFSLCGLMEIGPSVGWSRQWQEFNVRKVRFEGVPGEAESHLQYTNHWQGPWIGMDAQLHLCGFNCRGGYSYHWATWNAKWDLKNRSFDWMSFSDKRKSSDAHGQVLYLDVLWGFCPFIKVGVGFKWQRWEAKKGKGGRISEYVPNGSRDLEVVDRVKHATWNSYAISANLGVSF